MRATPLAALILPALLALAACTPAPPAAPVQASADLHQATTVFPQQLQALGNEPFWSVQADGQQLHWSSPENLQGVAIDAQREQIGDVLHYRGQMGAEPVTLSISVEPCSDGMSDTQYPWSAQWQQGGAVYSGCARPPLAP